MIAGININKDKLASMQRAFSLLRNANCKKILSFIADHPGSNNRTIASGVRMNENRCSDLLKPLTEANIIVRMKNSYQVNRNRLMTLRRIANSLSGIDAAYQTCRKLKDPYRFNLLKQIANCKDIPQKDLPGNKSKNSISLKFMKEKEIIHVTKDKSNLLQINKDKLRILSSF